MAMITYTNYELIELPYRPCGIQSRLGMDSLPFHVYEDGHDAEVIHYAKTHFEELVEADDPTFWKQRIVIHVLDSERIVSASFVPYKDSKNRLIFTQKKNQFSNSNNIKELQSFANVHLPILPEILAIFNFFINDRNTQSMSLVFEDPSDCSEQLFSIGWNKPCTFLT